MFSSKKDTSDHDNEEDVQEERSAFHEKVKEHIERIKVIVIVTLILKMLKLTAFHYPVEQCNRGNYAKCETAWQACTGVH